jgi:hypothetical protein
MSVKSALSSAAVLVLGALALTACQPGSGTAVGSAPPQHANASTAAPGTTAPVSAPSTRTPASTSGSGGKVQGSNRPSSNSPSSNSPSGNGQSSNSQGGSATSDSYAYTHPCSARQLSVHVVRRASAAGQRVIEVRNLGAKSCGLSYYPLVDLDNSHATDGSRAVKPLVPGGLGGPPAYPLYAGRTAYAVIDLDPSGATTGTVRGVDELNVLADGDHMPAADTLSFPLGSGALVLKPKLGLYQFTVADAVTSMTTADTQL